MRSLRIAGIDGGGKRVIVCKQASQTVNLLYSAIKFVRFESFSWQGESLPLSMRPLGELVLSQIVLTDQAGYKQPDVRWERGLLFAPFKTGKTYTLNMRLEYRGPFNMDPIFADFQSIHPYVFHSHVDFLCPLEEAVTRSARVVLGKEEHRVPLTGTYEASLLDGTEIKATRDAQNCSLAVSNQSAVPYGHQHFPQVFIPQDHLGPRW